jgi:Lon protease-like protein
MTSLSELKDLPKQIPLFDLPGVLLLPRARLPAQIQETKYLKLLVDVMGRERYVGFIQPQGDEDDAPLFTTGCLGKVTTFVDKEDGSFFVIFTGLIRFKLQETFTDPKGYRCAHVSYEPFLLDLYHEAPSIKNREYLLQLLQLYFKHTPLHTQWEEITRTSDENLLSLLTMIGPFEPIEKQAILETSTLEDRSQLIGAFMEMATLTPLSKIERAH